MLWNIDSWRKKFPHTAQSIKSQVLLAPYELQRDSSPLLWKTDFSQYQLSHCSLKKHFGFWQVWHPKCEVVGFHLPSPYTQISSKLSQKELVCVWVGGWVCVCSVHEVEWAKPFKCCNCSIICKRKIIFILRLSNANPLIRRWQVVCEHCLWQTLQNRSLFKNKNIRCTQVKSLSSNSKAQGWANFQPHFMSLPILTGEQPWADYVDFAASSPPQIAKHHIARDRFDFTLLMLSMVSPAFFA